MTAAFDVNDPIVTLPDDLLIGEELVPAMAQNQAAPATWHKPRSIWDQINDEDEGEGVLVTVGDTGYDSDHPLLPKAKFADSFIRGESAEDRNSHGTHCSGTVLGRDRNIGIAPKADLGIVKILSNSGSGSSSGIAKGIRHAVDKGSDIINLSLGGGSSYQPTIDSINYAFSKGCIVCIAAGNSGFSGRGNTIGWPARSGRGICVAATRQDGSTAGFSSGGAQIDVASPGQQILSTIPGGGLGMMSGTSMATPFTAGCFALIVSRMRRLGHARWTAVEAVKQFIKDNTTDRGNPGWDPWFGHGTLNMLDIITKLHTGDLKWGV